MLTPDEVNNLKSQPEWIALQEHLEDCLRYLDSCTSIADDDDHDKASRGRKEAVRILHAVLEPFYYEPEEQIDKRAEMMKKLGL